MIDFKYLYASNNHASNGAGDWNLWATIFTYDCKGNPVFINGEHETDLDSQDLPTKREPLTKDLLISEGVTRTNLWNSVCLVK